MNLLLIVVGVIASAVAAAVTREIMLWFVVQPIRLESETRLEQLRAAQIDVNLVKAIRAGDIDADELAQIGVLDDASEGDPPPLTAAPDLARQLSWAQSLVASRTKQPRNPYEDLEPGSAPRFVPTFYTRHPDVRDLDPGDEVWIQSTAVYHDEDGVPVVRSGATTSLGENSGYRVRLRVYTDGSLELGTRPGVVINDRADTIMPRRTVARILNLDTAEIREVTQTSKDDTPGRHPWRTDD